VLRRIERDTVVLATAGAALAAGFWPHRLGVAGGVVGGALLMGLSYLAIRAVVDGVLEGRSRAWLLVKFFTRHGILALAGYGMMARLRLDPLAMLAGVGTFGLAAAVEAGRALQTQLRRPGRYSPPRP
jgi:hypothetical protein